MPRYEVRKASHAPCYMAYALSNAKLQMTHGLRFVVLVRCSKVSRQNYAVSKHAGEFAYPQSPASLHKNKLPPRMTGYATKPLHTRGAPLGAEVTKESRTLL